MITHMFILGNIIEALFLWLNHQKNKKGLDGAIQELKKRKQIHYILVAELVLILYTLVSSLITGAPLLGKGYAIVACFLYLIPFIMFHGLASVDLVPTVNIQSIFSINLVVVLFLATQGSIGILFWIAMGINLLIFALLRLNHLHYMVKSLLYLWYLALVIYVMWDNIYLFESQTLTLGQAFLLGISFVFFGIHGIMAVRFFVLTAATILPYNRPPLKPLANYLISDEKLSLTTFIALAGTQVILYLTNFLTKFTQNTLIINLLALIFVQVFVGMLGKKRVKPEKETLSPTK